MKVTPPLLARGRYQLKMPWNAEPTQIYVCMAIRSFADIYELGKDVFETYYVPMGLGKAEFESDRKAEANIITLMSEDSPVIYVPDTYILSYPDMNNVTYSHVVMSMSLGALPDYLSFEHLGSQIANLASDVIGVVPTVRVHKAPHAGVITPEEHEVLEVNRLASVQLRETDHARVLQLQVERDVLQQKLTALEQLVIDNGLLG